jgi:hypothetical protein
MASDLLDVIARNGKAFQDTEDEVARRKTITAARALIASLENPAEQLARIGWGEPTRTAALQVAFELGLLEKLNDKPMSSTQLAEGTKGTPEIVGASHAAPRRGCPELTLPQPASSSISPPSTWSKRPAATSTSRRPSPRLLATRPSTVG